MDTISPTGSDFRRFVFDGALACLLALVLGGVYWWDVSRLGSEVAATPGAENLLVPDRSVAAPLDGPESNANASADSTAAPQSGPPSNTARNDAPRDPGMSVEGGFAPNESEVGPFKPLTSEVTSADDASQKTEAPPKREVFRINGGSRPQLSEPPPKPEPPPVVVAKLLTDNKLNEFGNPEGDEFGLAKKGEFGGARLLVWTADGEVQANVFTSDNPLWAALKDKGFDITTKTGSFEPKWLDDADQLWAFAGRVPGMSEEGYAAVTSFVKSGKGLYLVADNTPYLIDAQFPGTDAAVEAQELLSR